MLKFKKKYAIILNLNESERVNLIFGIIWKKKMTISTDSEVKSNI